jgi:Pectate lyase superfamily protein
MILNVVDFGATGDGHTDDSGAIQAAIVVCEGSRAGVTPAIDLNSPGGNALSCVATGVAAQSPVEAAFRPGPGTQLTIMNYHQRDTDHVITAITPLRMMHGPKVIFEVPPTA